MSDTTTGGGPGSEEDITLTAGGALELGGAPQQPRLVGPNRIVDAKLIDVLAHLASARTDMDMAEHHIGVAGYGLQDQPGDQAEVNGARALLQQAHGALWKLSRKIAGDHPPVPL